MIAHVAEEIDSPSFLSTTKIDLYSMKTSLSLPQIVVLAKYKNHKSCKMKFVQKSSAAHFNFSFIMYLYDCYLFITVALFGLF